MWRAPLRARVTPRGRPSRRTCGLHRCPVRLPCAAGGQGACARRRGARQIEWEGDGFGGRRRFGFVGQCPQASCGPLRARCRRRWCAFGAARAVVGLNIPKAATERARSPRGQREVRRCVRNTTTLRPNVFDGVSYLPSTSACSLCKHPRACARSACGTERAARRRLGWGSAAQRARPQRAGFGPTRRRPCRLDRAG